MYPRAPHSSHSYEILLEGLSTHAIIGILPDERTTPQRIDITLAITYTLPTSTSAHDLAHNSKEFLDYMCVRDTLITHLQEMKYHLLEEALDGSIALLHERFSHITHITLTLKKPDILYDCCVGVRKSVAL